MDADLLMIAGTEILRRHVFDNWRVWMSDGQRDETTPIKCYGPTINTLFLIGFASGGMR